MIFMSIELFALDGDFKLRNDDTTAISDQAAVDTLRYG